MRKFRNRKKTKLNLWTYSLMTVRLASCICHPAIWSLVILAPSATSTVLLPHVQSRTDCHFHLTPVLRGEREKHHLLLTACPRGMWLTSVARTNLKLDESEVGGSSAFSKRNNTSEGALKLGTHFFLLRATVQFSLHHLLKGLSFPHYMFLAP